MKRFLFPAAALILSACATAPDSADEVSACLAETFPVYFARDEKGLSAPAQELLDVAAERLSGCAGGSLEVVGYTDAVGNETLNQRIAGERAQAVLDGLTARGVQPQQIKLTPVGEAGAKTADGETVPMRRRVEVRFIP